MSHIHEELSQFPHVSPAVAEFAILDLSRDCPCGSEPRTFGPACLQREIDGVAGPLQETIRTLRLALSQSRGERDELQRALDETRAVREHFGLGEA